MKIRTFLGLAALGGAYYAHRKRGGDLSLESIKDSLNALRDGMQQALKNASAEAEAQLRSDRGKNAVDADIIEPNGGAPFKGAR